MPSPSKPTKSAKKQLPLLARHAVSLCLVFTVALVLSFFVGKYIHQQIQLGKLSSTDPATFERGLGYVVTRAGTNEGVTAKALDAVKTIDVQRAANLLLAIAQSHADREDLEELTIPQAVIAEIAPLMSRLDSMQAIALYDSLIQIKGIDPIATAQALLKGLQLNKAELLSVVDLLDARTIWYKPWAPQDTWVRWLGVLAESDSQLTQAQAAKQLGELPDATDDPRILASLKKLSTSKYEKVRNIVLQQAAGYATIAKDPIEFEQLIFEFGNDENKHIARRAWMIVGHLKPMSGFAVKWKEADPFVAEAMLWAAAKTNPGNPKPAWDAYDNAATRPLSLQALSRFRDEQSIQRFTQTIPVVPVEQINIDPDRLIPYLSSPDTDASQVIAIACVSIRSNRRDTPELIERLVRMRQSQPRLLGALLAALNGTRPTLIEGDFGRVFKQFPDTTSDDLHAMSDEKLDTLGLRRVDALPALLEAAEAAPPSANRSVEAKLLKLALWMRGDLGEDFTAAAEGMLHDGELPTSTVLMCLLHTKRPIALDYLFGDLVSQRPNLHKLFIQERFWHIFRGFVDSSDLPLWLEGAPEAQSFQLEAIMQWYAVNRWKIDQGWWPDVIDD